MADAWLSWVLQGSPVNRLLQEKKKKSCLQKTERNPPTVSVRLLCSQFPKHGQAGKRQSSLVTHSGALA